MRSKYSDYFGITVAGYPGYNTLLIVDSSLLTFSAFLSSFLRCNMFFGNSIIISVM